MTHNFDYDFVKANISCFIFLQIYSIANLNDVSWGTRQGKKDEKADNRSFFQRLLGKSPDEEDEEDWSGGEGGSCSCIFCPKIWRPKEEPPPPEQPTGRRRTTKPSQKPSPSLQTKQPTRPPSISSQEQAGRIEEIHEENFEDEDEDEENIQVLERIVMDESCQDTIEMECDFGGIQIKELRRTQSLEWTKKMTNYTEEESDCLERCLELHRQPTDTKIFKKLHLGLREIENYRENQISKSNHFCVHLIGKSSSKDR